MSPESCWRKLNSMWEQEGILLGGDSRPAIAAPQVSPGRGPRAGGLGGAVPPSERPAPIQTPALSCTRRGLIQGDGPPSHGFLPPWQRWGEGSSSTQDQKEKCHVACWDSPRERGSDFEGDTAEGHPCCPHSRATLASSLGTGKVVFVIEGGLAVRVSSWVFRLVLSICPSRTS